MHTRAGPEGSVRHGCGSVSNEGVQCMHGPGKVIQSCMGWEEGHAQICMPQHLLRQSVLPRMPDGKDIGRKKHSMEKSDTGAIFRKKRLLSQSVRFQTSRTRVEYEAAEEGHQPAEEQAVAQRARIVQVSAVVPHCARKPEHALRDQPCGAARLDLPSGYRAHTLNR